MSVGPIRHLAKLRQLLASKPALLRWYVSRTYQASAKDDSSVDLLYAEPFESALEQHLGLDTMSATLDQMETRICAQKDDKLEWWHLEDFDNRVHMTEANARKVFTYPDDKGPITEGMVFISITRGKHTRLIPFTKQARSESKRVFRRLFSGPDDKAAKDTQ